MISKMAEVKVEQSSAPPFHREHIESSEEQAPKHRSDHEISMDTSEPENERRDPFIKSTDIKIKQSSDIGSVCPIKDSTMAADNIKSDLNTDESSPPIDDRHLHSKVKSRGKIGAPMDSSASSHAGQELSINSKSVCKLTRFEELIIDGFAICAFQTWEDLQDEVNEQIAIQKANDSRNALVSMAETPRKSSKNRAKATSGSDEVSSNSKGSRIKRNDKEKPSRKRIKKSSSAPESQLQPASESTNVNLTNPRSQQRKEDKSIASTSNHSIIKDDSVLGSSSKHVLGNKPVKDSSQINNISSKQTSQVRNEGKQQNYSQKQSGDGSKKESSETKQQAKSPSERSASSAHFSPYTGVPQFNPPPNHPNQYSIHDQYHPNPAYPSYAFPIAHNPQEHPAKSRPDDNKQAQRAQQTAPTQPPPPASSSSGSQATSHHNQTQLPPHNQSLPDQLNLKYPHAYYPHHHHHPSSTYPYANMNYPYFYHHYRQQYAMSQNPPPPPPPPVLPGGPTSAFNGYPNVYPGSQYQHFYPPGWPPNPNISSFPPTSQASQTQFPHPLPGHQSHTNPYNPVSIADAYPPPYSSSHPYVITDTTISRQTSIIPSYLPTPNNHSHLAATSGAAAAAASVAATPNRFSHQPAGPSQLSLYNQTAAAGAPQPSQTFNSHHTLASDRSFMEFALSCQSSPNLVTTSYSNLTRSLPPPPAAASSSGSISLAASGSLTNVHPPTTNPFSHLNRWPGTALDHQWAAAASRFGGPPGAGVARPPPFPTNLLAPPPQASSLPPR